ncbi:MAG: bifunctional adenosylcobinamide kinase/adenosylcobinamide-phosphate guanylyltransferase [Rhodospirillales bacterium]|nr:bifunctional adenosylcobinamide kinase/adenosylcobinamide-phosphate guanylyltransferase [Rhodospirillales bacterium]
MGSVSPLPRVTLVLGGARSGKSLYSEGLFENSGGGIYLATAEARHADDLDGEMARRIAEHKSRRGPGWQTVEEPLDLAGALMAHAGSAVLVDCLTLWLSNIMMAGRDVEVELDALAGCLQGLAGPVVLVSNEVGQGIVPDNALARSYMDNAGRMNQRLAAAANRVVFVHAGLPQILKDAQ